MLGKTLVTGCNSGLGKFLKEHLNCDGWNRGIFESKYYDTVIHCAHDRNNHKSAIEILHEIHRIPCEKFIFISTVDVHNAFNLDNQYAYWKLKAEQFVRSSYGNHLILRCGAMIGEHAKENTITKLLNNKPLTVTKDSSFGVVHHSSILEMLDYHGTANFIGDVMRIDEIANELEIGNVVYGDYRYITPDIKETHLTINEIKKYVRNSIATNKG